MYDYYGFDVLFNEDAAYEKYIENIKREAWKEGYKIGWKEGYKIGQKELLQKYVNVCRKNKFSKDDIVYRLVRDFEFSEEEARSIVLELSNE